MRVALPDGTLLEDGAATGYVLARLPGFTALGRLGELPGGRALFRSLYAMLAGNRSWMSRLVRYRPLIVRRPDE